VTPVVQRPVEVYDLCRTSVASPSQWEGRVGNHGSIYIRYRWGRLTVRLATAAGDVSAPDTCIYDEDIGAGTVDRLGGFLETDQMQAMLHAVCHFHGACSE